MAAWRRGSLEHTLLADSPISGGVPVADRGTQQQLDAADRRLPGEPTPCLVVVGAAHLVGPDGLLTLLRQKGYRIEQQ